MLREDMPTQHNSPLYKDSMVPVDASVVATLRAAGALIFGKTTTTEFAVTTAGGPTCNRKTSTLCFLVLTRNDQLTILQERQEVALRVLVQQLAISKSQSLWARKLSVRPFDLDLIMASLRLSQLGERSLGKVSSIIPSLVIVSYASEIFEDFDLFWQH
jgi:hypothetical protein